MKTKKVKCSQCNIEFDKPVSYIKQGIKRGYPNHFCSNLCSRNFNVVLSKIYKKNRESDYNKNPKRCLSCDSPINYKEKFIQKYCSSRCAATHTQKDGGHKIWTEEDKKKLSTKMSGRKYPLRHKHRTKKKCKNCNKIFEVLPYRKNQLCCCRNCYLKWSKKTGYLKGKTGGYRQKGGRGKQGWYKGYYCNSSWELAWVIYNLDKGIKFTRNTKGFEYTFNDETYKFYPDFILENGDYVEVKGYLDGKQKAKIGDFPKKLEVIGKKEIKFFIEYVKMKHGKDFIKIYEKKCS